MDKGSERVAEAVGMVLVAIGDLCKTPPFAQLQRQAQILILEIFNIFLRLKFSPSLNLSKIEHFSKVSIELKIEGWLLNR